MLCELIRGKEYKLLQCLNNMYFETAKEIVICKTANEAYQLYLLTMSELLMEGWSLINYHQKPHKI